MPTLIHGCGFEEGGYTDGPFGAGAHNYYDGGAADNMSWDSSVKRNGRYSLKMAPTGSSASGRLNKPLTSTAHVVNSIWFRWNTLSSASGQNIITLTGTNAAIRIGDTGVLAATAGGGTVTGPTLSADTWHHIEFYWNGSANPHVLQWRANGTAQTNATNAVAAGSASEVIVRLSSTSSSVGWWDDWAISATGGDYPMGPVAIEAFAPDGDGTHVDQTNFKDESGTTSSGSSTYTKVDTHNEADFWSQTTAGGSSYLEWTLPNTTRANPIFAVSVSCAIRKETAIGLNQAAVRLRANSANFDVYTDGDFPWGSGAWFGKSNLFTTANGTAWTATIVNGATLRFGYGADVGPKPQLESIVMEVVFDDEPTETEGGGDPDPEPAPGEPGIWVDWDGDGSWVNETTRVTRMEWSRGASFDHVSSPGPGAATVIVQNADGRFNPDNTGGTLYGKLIPSRPIWAGADRTTGAMSTATLGTAVVTRGFFGGYVIEIVPTPVPGANPTAELICEDAFGVYRRSQASVEPTRDISRGDFRHSVLTAMGEDADRRDLEAETDIMPFAAADSRDGLSILDELNRSNSTRHWIQPADSYDEWYFYSTVNRTHKLTDEADEAWNADDVTEMSGYRVTADNIINLQRASVSPIDFSSLNEIVWQQSPLPLAVSTATPIVLWPEFADYVFNAAVQANTTGGTLTTTLTNFGTSAKLELTATGSVVDISSLYVTGSSLRRGDLQTVRSEDTDSQATYELRTGGDVSTDYIGQPGAAKAVTDYLVWKFAEPLKRPTVTIAGKSTSTITTLLDRDLYDVVTLTVDRLHMVARRFEIIGLRGKVEPRSGIDAPYFEISYELQETPNQEPVDYFVIDEDSINGPALIAPF